MSPSPPARVLILCRIPGDAQHLKSLLTAENLADGNGAAESFQVFSDAASIPAGEAIDVLVTDLEAVELEDRRSGLAASIATVRIGPSSNHSDDVVLPLDCTERELRLACKLSAQLARLRNQRDELARSQAEVMQLAETDPLTGLANRRAWDARLTSMLSRVAREGHPLWLALVDLDNFKAVNDREGMSRGDAVLVATGKSLAAAVRGDDLVARLGGDEFGILLSGVSDEQAGVVLDRLRAAVAKGGNVTASIGYLAARAGADRSSLLAAAERAMREAKSAGGNRVVASVLPS
jgi:diguanylate cyclase (GGDEF)-like protein